MPASLLNRSHSVLALVAVVAREGVEVVQLVGRRHQEAVGTSLIPHVRKILFLPRPPRRFRLNIGIRAVFDDVQHGLAEVDADDDAQIRGRDDGRVLQRVVQERADRLILGPAVLQRDGRDRHHVRDVGHRRPLALLVPVHAMREEQRAIEAVAECHRVSMPAPSQNLPA